jgi:hypothetical protein
MTVKSRKTDVGRRKLLRKRHKSTGVDSEARLMEDKIYDAVNHRAGFVAKNRNRFWHNLVDKG